MNTRRFETGQIKLTKGIQDLIANDAHYNEQLQTIIEKHQTGDWGEISQVDVEMNEKAIDDNLNIVSAHHLYDIPVFIFTDKNRSYTLIFLPEEY